MAGVGCCCFGVAPPFLTHSEPTCDQASDAGGASSPDDSEGYCAQEGPPRLDFDALVAQQFLQVADMGKHAVLLTLELLHVAPSFCAAGDAIGDVALEIQVDTMGAALGQGIAADLAHLCTCK